MRRAERPETLPGRHRIRPRRRVLAAVTAVLVVGLAGLAVVAPPSAAATAPGQAAPGQAASGQAASGQAASGQAAGSSGTTPAVPGVPAGRWTAVPVRGGTRVTLRLDRPLPARDAAAGLAVDGIALAGTRTGGQDRVLSVVTVDPAARRPTRVQVTFSGQVAAAAPAATTGRRPAAVAPIDLTGSTATGAPVSDDPAAAGRFRVRRLDYDLGDTALALRGLGGRRVEERAAVYAPVGAPGRRPVVVFLHGRHDACYTPGGTDTSTWSWPCPRGMRPVPSHLGYGAPATTLASRGYVVVSVSADGINALDNTWSVDGGAQARGELVMAHLDLLAAADAGRVGGRIGAAARNRLDLSHIGLMGHSRGGEGMVRAAAVNAARPHPYGIRGVLPLAPVDFSRAALPGITTAVVLPYCDGDVTDLQGQHLFDDSRYAARDDVLRASVLVMGADHNFFNTEWTPGQSVAPSSDDWFLDADTTCGVDAGHRLTARQQQAVGTAYIVGFFRLSVGGERSMLPLFDGSAGRAPSAGPAVVWTAAQAPGRDRVDVAGLEITPAAYRLSGPMAATRCASMVVPGTLTTASPGPCVESYAPERWPSFTPATLAPDVPATPVVDLRWTGAGARASVPVPAAARDVRAFDALTLRLSPDGTSADAPVGPVDLSIGVVDGHGRAADLPVSGLSAALGQLPGGEPFLGKRWLRTVRLPLSRLGRVDLSDVRQVRLTALSATGAALVSDVAFSRSALGTGGGRLPVVSVVSARLVPSGNGSVVRASVRLSVRAPRAVRVSVQILPSADILVRPAARTVTIPAGATGVATEYPLLYPAGDPSGSGDGIVVLADQTDAVMGTQNAAITRG